MESVEALRAREDEVARQWEWLQEAINLVARAKAEQEDAAAFRLLQHHAMDIGQRRVELMLKMAAVGSSQARSGRELAGRGGVDPPAQPLTTGSSDGSLFSRCIEPTDCR